jgi:hypothetical protein
VTRFVTQPPQNPEMYTTALAEACSHGNLDVLKRLKPDPFRDDPGGLLRHAAFSACCRGAVLGSRRSVRLGGHECEGTKIRTTPPRFA